MLEFQEKRKFKKFLYCRLTSIFLLILVILILKGVWEVYEKQHYTKDNLTRVASDLQNLKERELMLSSEIQRLKTENGKEQEVREKFGLVRPGEEVIIIVDDLDGEEEGAGISGKSFWQKVLDWLK